MADEYCKTLLGIWGLPDLAETFDRNEINKTVMEQLTPELVKELIPKIGPRLTFWTKWKKHFGQKDSELSTRSPSCSSTRSSITSKESSAVVASCDSDSANELSSDKENEDSHDMTRQDCFIGAESYEKLRVFSVKQVLQKSFQGSAILKAYKKTRELNRKARNIIVDCIISEVTSANIRGKLVDKYRNVVHAYKKLVVGTVNTEEIEQNHEVDTEVEESIAWLSKNQAPWEVVLSHWEKTAAIRRKRIENNKETTKKIYNIYETWPILNHPDGYALIDADFSYMNLSATKMDISKWNNFLDAISALSPLNTKDTNAIALKELIATDDINDDSRVTAQLLLLPHLIPPRGRIRVDKKHWKPTIGECKDSILLHATIAGDVAVIQEKRINAMQKLSLPLQPFIIVVGTDITRISASYICVDQILYNVPSTIAAVDICFKVFHVLNAAYPPESEHLWLLIQLAFYQFQTRWDKNISYITEIISCLKKKQDTTRTSEDYLT